MTVILRQKIGSGATRTCSSTCHMATKDKCACITCGNPIEGRGTKFCSLACYHKGHSLGLTSQRRATVHQRVCRFCSKEFTVKHRRVLAPNQGVYCSTTCLNRAQAQERVKRHKGGIRRQLAIVREAFMKGELHLECLICGFSQFVETAHIIPATKGGRYELDNLLLLCPNHHQCFDYGKLTGAELAKLPLKAQEAYNSGVNRPTRGRPRSSWATDMLREKATPQ